jgi:D-sedoheptulose 7-phosphate isomerase
MPKNSMEEIVRQILEDSIAVKRRSILQTTDRICRAVDKLANCLAQGGKILIFGNGGSAADAQHLAAEFINRFRLERRPLGAVALTTDTSVITSIGNDYRFDDIFAKQVAALGRPPDVAWGLSTSGNSPNVVNAIKLAHGLGLGTIAMTGRGGRLTDSAEVALTVDSDVTARIQEAHITMGHILCELVEGLLFHPDGTPRH